MEQSFHLGVYHDIHMNQSAADQSVYHEIAKSDVTRNTGTEHLADQGVCHEIVDSNVDFTPIKRLTTNESCNLQSVNHIDHVHELSAYEDVYHEIVDRDVEYQPVNWQIRVTGNSGYLMQPIYHVENTHEQVNRHTIAGDEESGYLTPVNHVDHIHEQSAYVSTEQQHDTVQLPLRVSSRTTFLELHSISTKLCVVLVAVTLVITTVCTIAISSYWKSAHTRATQANCRSLNKSVLTAARYTHDLAVPFIEAISILSVSSSGFLLVGHQMTNGLHVFCSNGTYVTCIKLPKNDTFIDAAWLPHNDTIVCTTFSKLEILVISLSGEVIARTENLVPLYLSVSTDDVVYVTGTLGGVYQSTDNGLSWCLLIKTNSHEDWEYLYAIKVSNNSYSDNIWTISNNNAGKLRLSIHTINSSLNSNTAHCNVLAPTLTLPDVKAPTSVNATYGRPLYDGHTNVLLTDKFDDAVHVWSVNGQYERRLLLSREIFYRGSVALDRQRHVMYVGQLKGVVAVFSLMYQ